MDNWGIYGMEKLNIYQRLARVMAAVSYVQKESKRVNNQYTFVSHDAVTAKIRPALIEHGIVSVPRVVGHTEDGNRTIVEMEVDFVNIDRPEDRVTVPCYGFGIDPQDKGPGKAMSYAVKYAYLKVLALETGDDPERDLIDHKPAKQAEAEKPITAEQASELVALLDETQSDYEKFLAYFKLSDLAEMPAAKFEKAKAMLEKKLPKEAA